MRRTRVWPATLAIVASLMGLIAALWVAVWFIALMTAPKARAHSWYPSHCCSERDCAPLEASRVWALNNGGYVIDGKFHVAADKALDSPDGTYHACFAFNGTMLNCFFAPRRSA